MAVSRIIRWNTTTHIWELSTDFGGTWAALPLDASILNQGTINAARLPTTVPSLTPVRGGIIYANASPAWAQKAVGTGLLKADGTDVLGWSTLVDADVAAGAAIGWTKLSKSGSSLADLGTRSAADLSSGLLALARGGTHTDLSGTGGAGKFLKQVTAGSDITVVQPATADISDIIGWTDYSSTSTVSGWSSLTHKSIFVFKIGKLSIWNFFFDGTSNAAAHSFTISVTTPNTDAGVCHNQINGYDGSFATGKADLPKNSSTVSLYKDNANTNFASSGEVQIIGQLMVQSA